MTPGWGLNAGLPAAGGAALWLDALGSAKGRAVLMSGASLDAEECRRIGVFHEIVAAEALMARAHVHAARLAALPDLTRRHTRRALTRRLQASVLAEVPFGDALIALAARSAEPLHEVQT